MGDLTRRLRMSDDGKDVKRERELAYALFYRDIDVEQPLSEEQMSRVAKRSIAAACAFWEEWDIAVLTPDLAPDPQAVR